MYFSLRCTTESKVLVAFYIFFFFILFEVSKLKVSKIVMEKNKITKYIKLNENAQRITLSSDFVCNA